MDNQASNVNFFDDLEKWLDLSNYARPLGKSPTVDGDFGSKEKPRDAWQPKPETESKCMAVRIVDEMWLARRPLEV